MQHSVCGLCSENAKDNQRKAEVCGSRGWRRWCTENQPTKNKFPARPRFVDTSRMCMSTAGRSARVLC